MARKQMGLDDEIHVSGMARAVAQGYSDHDIPGGSAHIDVMLELPLRIGRPFTNCDRQEVSIDIAIKGGPSPDSTHSITVFPNDVPHLIACLIHAAYVGVVDGALPVTQPAGVALVRRLRTVLPEFEFHRRDIASPGIVLAPAQQAAEAGLL